MIAGIDALVFTGGIGEHSPEVRRRVADHIGGTPSVADVPMSSASLAAQHEIGTDKVPPASGHLSLSHPDSARDA